MFSCNSSPELDETEYFDIELADGKDNIYEDDDPDDDTVMDYRSQCYRPERINDPCCPGQLIKWTVGPIWHFYAYQAHSTKVFPWMLDRFEKGYIVIYSRKECTGYLETPANIKRGICASCADLTTSAELINFISCAKEETAKPNTPWIYLNYNQLKNLLIASRKKKYGT